MSANYQTMFLGVLRTENQSHSNMGSESNQSHTEDVHPMLTQKWHHAIPHGSAPHARLQFKFPEVKNRQDVCHEMKQDGRV